MKGHIKLHIHAIRSVLYGRYNSFLLGQYEVLKSFIDEHLCTTRLPAVGLTLRVSLQHQLQAPQSNSDPVPSFLNTPSAPSFPTQDFLHDNIRIDIILDDIIS